MIGFILRKVPNLVEVWHILHDPVGCEHREAVIYGLEDEEADLARPELTVLRGSAFQGV